MNSGNFANGVNKRTTQILNMIEQPEPMHETAQALAVVAVASCSQTINIDIIFEELKKLDGFETLISLLDLNKTLDTFEQIDPVEVYEIAEPYTDNRAQKKQVKKVIKIVVKLIDDIRKILREADNVPAVLKIKNFAFFFLYFLVLDCEGLDPENILTDMAVEFERMILIYSNDLLKDLEEIKGLQNERVKQIYARKYKNQTFKLVHDTLSNDCLSSALTIFDDKSGFIDYEHIKIYLINFLLYYRFERYDTKPTTANLKLNLDYCKYVAEKIFKNELPLLIDRLEGHEGIEGFQQDYLNKDFKAEFIKMNSFLEIEKAHPTELNEYLDMFKYENFKNFFDYDDIEIYDKYDLNKNLENFEAIFNTFESIVLNVFFSNLNANTWGENAFINVIKFIRVAEHYFNLFNKFKINDCINKEVLTKLADLLILHLYLKTYDKTGNFKEELKEFFNSLKFYYLQDVKNNFNSFSDSSESSDSDE